MQDITIRFLEGPLRGQKLQREIGEVVIGRQPPDERKDIELKGANTSVSRSHAELGESDGNIVLRNLSPNGTTVNGKLIVDEVAIKSGAVIEIGDQFKLDVTWQSFGADVRPSTKKSKKAGPEKKGPLSSPVVRAVLGIYLGGIVVLGLWLMMSGDDGRVADDWPALLASYEAWQSPEIAADTWDAREARAAVIVREMRALKTQGHSNRTGTLCRELMSIDGEISSPLYRYGARCLAER